MRVNGTDIYMTRGDSETFRVSLFDKIIDAKRYFVNGDIVYFTVKTSTQTQTITIQKIITEFEDGEAIVHITPEDTKGLKYYTYVYDVQMVKGANEESLGGVTTIIKPSKFIIEEEVTYD